MVAAGQGPGDLPGAARRFVRRLGPCALVLVEQVVNFMHAKWSNPYARSGQIYFVWAWKDSQGEVG